MDSRQITLNEKERRILKETSESNYFSSFRSNMDKVIEQSSQKRLTGDKNKMAYEEVTGVPENLWDKEKEAVIEGKFLRKEEGQFGFNYILEVKKEEVLVFGKVALHTKMAKVKEGDKIKIEFLGEVKAKSGMMYQDYKVSIDK